MYSLYLLRHAKSSWDYPELEDFKRPLNKRGKTDCILIGKLLKQNNDIPEVIISSPAKRAYSTAKRVLKEMGSPETILLKEDTLYMAGINDFLDVLSGTDDKIKKLMLVSHNFGITDFANYLSGSAISNIPTCGTVKIETEKSWKNLKKNDGEFCFFEFPKKHY